MRPKLDRLTPIAILGGLGAVLISMLTDGANPATLIKPGPLVLVLGGTLFAAAGGFMRRDVRSVREVFMQAMGPPERDPEATITLLVRMAQVARKEGLLALEKAAGEVTDPYFRLGVEMTVDGASPEEITEALGAEISALVERHRVGVKFFNDMGGFSPTLGIIGTVIGLVQVLGNLSDPSALGPAIASAFTATLWGVLAANLVWLPIGNKLKRASDLEVQTKRMILNGILAVQEGMNPRMVQTRLQAYLPPSRRGRAQTQAAAAPQPPRAEGTP